MYAETETENDLNSTLAPTQNELRTLRSSALVSGTARAAFRSALDAALARGRVLQPSQLPPADARTAHPGTSTSRRSARRTLPSAPNSEEAADYGASSLGSEIDQLVENSVVQALLESAFRTELENVVSRRASEAFSRITPRSYAPHRQVPVRPSRPQPEPAISHGYRNEIEALSRQVANLERMIAASFELQLSVQRIVQQEVAAALALSRRATCNDGGSGYHAEEEPTAHGTTATAAQRKPGVCILCCDREVNCAFNGCGHMCFCMQVTTASASPPSHLLLAACKHACAAIELTTAACYFRPFQCLQCAHVAHARGEVACPMCRAPIRERLHVYPDWVMV